MALEFLNSFKTRIQALSFTWRLFFCLLSGMAVAAALPPTYIWAGAFIGLSLFYVLIHSFSVRASFLAGWLYGFGFFTIGLYWIGNALLVEGNDYQWAWPLAVAGLPAALSLFTALAALLIRKFTNSEKLSGFLFFVIIMAAAEYLRGTLFTGFPWNLYGYIWGNSLPIMQSLSLGGVYALTTLTIFWATLAGYALQSTNKKAVITVVAVGIVSFTALYIYGQNRLNASAPANDESAIIHIVQPNIKQEDKWNRDKAEDNLNTLVSLSQGRAEYENAARFVVWPETALNYRLLGNPEYQRLLRGMMPANTHLISGYFDAEKRGEDVVLHNSIAVFDSNMQRQAIYDKSHLVPFGEYIPFQNWIPLEPVTRFSGFEEGAGKKTLSVGAHRFSPLICYEIIFPARVTAPSQTGSQRPQWIVNATNDAWYGDSAGPHQHLTITRFRAVEEGIPVIRAANTGISALIDSYGRVIKSLALNKSGFIEAPAPPALEQQTLFSKYGNMVFAALLVSLLILSLALRIRDKD